MTDKRTESLIASSTIENKTLIDEYIGLFEKAAKQWFVKRPIPDFTRPVFRLRLSHKKRPAKGASLQILDMGENRIPGFTVYPTTAEGKSIAFVKGLKRMPISEFRIKAILPSGITTTFPNVSLQTSGSKTYRSEEDFELIVAAPTVAEEKKPKTKKRRRRVNIAFAGGSKHIMRIMSLFGNLECFNILAIFAKGKIDEKEIKKYGRIRIHKLSEMSDDTLENIDGLIDFTGSPEVIELWEKSFLRKRKQRPIIVLEGQRFLKHADDLIQRFLDVDQLMR